MQSRTSTGGQSQPATSNCCQLLVPAEKSGDCWSFDSQKHIHSLCMSLTMCANAEHVYRGSSVASSLQMHI